MLPTSCPNPNLLSSFPLNPIRDIRNNLWTQNLLTSLQVNQTYGQLVHCDYYCSFSSLDLGYPTPSFLSTTNHYFEWQSKFDPNIAQVSIVMFYSTSKSLIQSSSALPSLFVGGTSLLLYQDKFVLGLMN